MLILRVLSGRAWDKDTSKTAVSTIKFSPHSNRSDGAEHSGTRVHVEMSKMSISDGQPEGSLNDKTEISQV